MDILMYFFIYSFVGWIIEVAYAYYKTNRFTNRGFLLSPFIPIYGLSAVFLHLAVYGLFPDFSLLSPFYLLVIFVLVTVISTLLEFVGGAILYHVFETRWWDYSHLPHNINGYIALRFSLMWGLMGFLLFTLVHHLFMIDWIASLSETVLVSVITPLVLIFIIDWVTTVIMLLNIKTHLKKFVQSIQLLKERSSLLSKQIGPERANTIRSNLNMLMERMKDREQIGWIRSKTEQIKIQLSQVDEHTEQTQEAVDWFKSLANKISSNRLFKVFPNVKIALKNKWGRNDDDENKS